MLFDVFPHEAGFGAAFVNWVLAPAAAAGAIVCSAQALFENDIRRMIAFSSAAQVGLILLGFTLGTVAGVSASVFYIIAHALMKGAMFMALGALAASVKARTLQDFAGVVRDAPWSAVAFGVGVASLMGAPLTMGFLAKWRLIEASLAVGEIWAVAVIGAGSLLTLLYCGRMLEAVFFRMSPPGAQRAREAPVGVLAPLWVLAGLSVWFGVDASLPQGLSDAAARALTGGAP
jgi:multicomponent Na+:H+ antiporter subunit D